MTRIQLAVLAVVLAAIGVVLWSRSRTGDRVPRSRTGGVSASAWADDAIGPDDLAG